MKFDYGEKLNYLNRELTDVVKYLLDKGANPFYKPEQDVIKGIKRPLPFHEAAKNGDRSENGDYIYGKRRLRVIDRRGRYLT